MNAIENKDWIGALLAFFTILLTIMGLGGDLYFILAFFCAVGFCVRLKKRKEVKTKDRLSKNTDTGLIKENEKQTTQFPLKVWLL